MPLPSTLSIGRGLSARKPPDWIGSRSSADNETCLRFALNAFKACRLPLERLGRVLRASRVKTKSGAFSRSLGRARRSVRRRYRPFSSLDRPLSPTCTLLQIVQQSGRQTTDGDKRNEIATKSAVPHTRSIAGGVAIGNAAGGGTKRGTIRDRVRSAIAVSV
jgi:hypothetical protein